MIVRDSKGEPGRLTLEEFFMGYEPSRLIFEALQEVINTIGPVDVRVTNSQVAFVRRRAFAWAWIPDRYLHGNHAPLVLSLAFHEKQASSRWKQIVEPGPGRFMHHLELFSQAEIDDEVKTWIMAARELAAKG